MPNRKNSFFCTLVALLTLAAVAQAEPVFQEYAVPPGSHPHDVAPSADGGVWYTAQRLGALGHLDPAKTRVANRDAGKFCKLLKLLRPPHLSS